MLRYRVQERDALTEMRASDWWVECPGPGPGSVCSGLLLAEYRKRVVGDDRKPPEVVEHWRERSETLRAAIEC